MNSIPRACRNATSLSRSCCRCAQLSSFTAIAGGSQHQVPSVLLPSTTTTSADKDFGVPAPLSLGQYPQRHSVQSPAPFWHNASLSQITDIDWHVMAEHLLSHSSSPHLQNETDQQSQEPEKPKWEEERHPDIGKTIDIVSNHLPFLLIQPLPPSILASKIEVCLFPTTHPSLPTLRLGKFLYRTFFRAVRWFAPVFLHRNLSSFGSPSGIKGIGLEITCFRVIKAEDGRRIEARWRTSSSPWSMRPDSSPRSAEPLSRTWSGWFYFDVDRKGKIVRHIVENVNNQRKVDGENKLKDILVQTVSNGRALGQGFGAMEVEKSRIQGGSRLRWMMCDIPGIFPEPSSSNIYVSARTYC